MRNVFTVSEIKRWIQERPNTVKSYLEKGIIQVVDDNGNPLDMDSLKQALFGETKIVEKPTPPVTETVEPNVPTTTRTYGRGEILKYAAPSTVEGPISRNVIETQGFIEPDYTKLKRKEEKTIQEEKKLGITSPFEKFIYKHRKGIIEQGEPITAGMIGAIDEATFGLISPEHFVFTTGTDIDRETMKQIQKELVERHKVAAGIGHFIGMLPEFAIAGVGATATKAPELAARLGAKTVRKLTKEAVKNIIIRGAANVTKSALEFGFVNATRQLVDDMFKKGRPTPEVAKEFTKGLGEGTLFGFAGIPEGKAAQYIASAAVGATIPVAEKLMNGERVTREDALSSAVNALFFVALRGTGELQRLGYKKQNIKDFAESVINNASAEVYRYIKEGHIKGAEQLDFTDVRKIVKTAFANYIHSAPKGFQGACKAKEVERVKDLILIEINRALEKTGKKFAKASERSRTKVEEIFKKYGLSSKEIEKYEPLIETEKLFKEKFNIDVLNKTDKEILETLRVPKPGQTIAESEAQAFRSKLNYLKNRFSKIKNRTGEKVDYVPLSDIIANKPNKTFKDIKSVGFLDGNDLKRINDQFGQQLGDEYIYRLYQELKKIPETIIVRRSGGKSDEFVILSKLTENQLEEQLHNVFERLKENPIIHKIGNKKVVAIRPTATVTFIDRGNLPIVNEENKSLAEFIDNLGLYNKALKQLYRSKGIKQLDNMFLRLNTKEIQNTERLKLLQDKLNKLSKAKEKSEIKTLTNEIESIIKGTGTSYTREELIQRLMDRGYTRAEAENAAAMLYGVPEYHYKQFRGEGAKYIASIRPLNKTEIQNKLMNLGFKPTLAERIGKEIALMDPRNPIALIDKLRSIKTVRENKLERQILKILYGNQIMDLLKYEPKKIQYIHIKPGSKNLFLYGEIIKALETGDKEKLLRMVKRLSEFEGDKGINKILNVFIKNDKTDLLFGALKKPIQTVIKEYKGKKYVKFVKVPTTREDLQKAFEEIERLALNMSSDQTIYTNITRLFEDKTITELLFRENFKIREIAKYVSEIAKNKELFREVFKKKIDPSLITSDPRFQKFLKIVEEDKHLQHLGTKKAMDLMKEIKIRYDMAEVVRPRIVPKKATEVIEFEKSYRKSVEELSRKEIIAELFADAEERFANVPIIKNETTIEGKTNKIKEILNNLSVQFFGKKLDKLDVEELGFIKFVQEVMKPTVTEKNAYKFLRSPRYNRFYRNLLTEIISATDTRTASQKLFDSLYRLWLLVPFDQVAREYEKKYRTYTVFADLLDAANLANARVAEINKALGKTKLTKTEVKELFRSLLYKTPVRDKKLENIIRFVEDRLHSIGISDIRGVKYTGGKETTQRKRLIDDRLIKYLYELAEKGGNVKDVQFALESVIKTYAVNDALLRNKRYLDIMGQDEKGKALRNELIVRARRLTGRPFMADTELQDAISELAEIAGIKMSKRDANTFINNFIYNIYASGIGYKFSSVFKNSFQGPLHNIPQLGFKDYMKGFKMTLESPLNKRHQKLLRDAGILQAKAYEAPETRKELGHEEIVRLWEKNKNTLKRKFGIVAQREFERQVRWSMAMFGLVDKVNRSSAYLGAYTKVSKAYERGGLKELSKVLKKLKPEMREKVLTKINEAYKEEGAEGISKMLKKIDLEVDGLKKDVIGKMVRAYTKGGMNEVSKILKTSHPATKEVIIKELAKGNIEKAFRIFSLDVTANSQWLYHILASPAILKYQLAKIFSPFTTWPANYWTKMIPNLVRYNPVGFIEHALLMFAAYLGLRKYLGVNPSYVLPYKSFPPLLTDPPLVVQPFAELFKGHPEAAWKITKQWVAPLKWYYSVTSTIQELMEGPKARTYKKGRKHRKTGFYTTVYYPMRGYRRELIADFLGTPMYYELKKSYSETKRKLRKAQQRHNVIEVQELKRKLEKIEKELEFFELKPTKH